MGRRSSRPDKLKKTSKKANTHNSTTDVFSQLAHGNSAQTCHMQ